MDRMSLRLGWRMLPALLLAARAAAVDASTTSTSPTPSPTPYANASCPASCQIAYPDVYEYTWSAVSYEASITKEITVATLVILIDDATNKTFTSTELAASTVTEGFPKPDATNEATLTIERLPGEIITTVLAYPTPYLDYGSNYTIEEGQLLTERICSTYDTAQVYNPNRHPALPTPASDYITDKTDSLGSFYTLVPVDDPIYDNFQGFYHSAFVGESGVASCTLATTTRVGSETASTPAATSPLTHTSVSFLTATTTKRTSLPPNTTPESQGAGKPTPSPKPSTTPSPKPPTTPSTPRPNGGGQTPTPTFVGTVPVVVVGGETVSVGGGRVDVSGTPVRLTVVTSNGAEVTEVVVGFGGGAFGGAVQTSIPVTWPAQTPSIATLPATPTLIDGSVPAVIVDGQTVSVGGGRVNVQGTPVRLTVFTTNGATVTGAVVGYGGGAFGGAVVSTVPLTFTTPNPQISACDTQLEITPTYISTTPVAVISDVWLSVNGPSGTVCGTPVRVTAVATTVDGKPTTITEALIGYGGGAFGGQVQSTVTLDWSSTAATATGKDDLGGYIESGLGGGADATATNSQFEGAAPPSATAASSGSMFGLVVAGVVGLLI